jgi:hypothetical protein
MKTYTYLGYVDSTNYPFCWTTDTVDGRWHLPMIFAHRASIIENGGKPMMIELKIAQTEDREP